MGAMRKNAKKKVKQRAHAEKRKLQSEAMAAVAAERSNAGGLKRPPMGRS